MLSDSILANAGWLFFAAYSAVVAVVNIAAFGGDVVHAKAPVDVPQKTGLSDAGQLGPLLVRAAADTSALRPGVIANARVLTSGQRDLR